MKQLDLALAESPRKARTAALRSFHIGQPGGHASIDEALDGERAAQRQEDMILGWFRQCEEAVPGARARWTPSDVHSEHPFRYWPITSVRRALTNLTTRGLLLHHRTDRRPGPYGAKESTWSLA